MISKNIFTLFLVAASACSLMAQPLPAAIFGNFTFTFTFTDNGTLITINDYLADGSGRS